MFLKILILILILKKLIFMFSKPLKKNDDIFTYGASQVQARSKPFIRIYEQVSPEIVHGPSCRTIVDIDKEIFTDICKADNIPITPRRGGGGTVILSPGVLVIIVVDNKKNSNATAQNIFRRIHAPITAAICKAGIDGVVSAGISDLSVNGKKILGSSLYMGSISSNSPLFYYQSSLMVSNDISLMDRYLRHPPREPEYRQGRGHSQFCTTLKELGLQKDIGELARLIELELRDRL
jgi:lipoate-protein ligase A